MWTDIGYKHTLKSIQQSTTKVPVEYVANCCKFLLVIRCCCMTIQKVTTKFILITMIKSLSWLVSTWHQMNTVLNQLMVIGQDKLSMQEIFRIFKRPMKGRSHQVLVSLVGKPKFPCFNPNVKLTESHSISHHYVMCSRGNLCHQSVAP